MKATKLEGTDRVLQLLECCDDQFRKVLTRNAGGTLAEMTEDDVFTAMRRLAVREENAMVARVTLKNMRQDQDEPIRAYGARLKGQASVCKYVQQCADCGANVDYTEAILRDVLCRGLEDTEIQMDLLGDKNQDVTLEQALKFVEAKEAGKRSASRLLLPQATDAVAGSSYRRQKKQSAGTPSSKDQDTCTYCGTKRHGKKTLQQELSAQPSVPNAVIVAEITTLNRCAGEKLAQNRQEAPDRKMPYSTHYARSHRRTAPSTPPWTTMSSIKPQRNG